MKVKFFLLLLSPIILLVGMYFFIVSQSKSWSQNGAKSYLNEITQVIESGKIDIFVNEHIFPESLRDSQSENKSSIVNLKQNFKELLRYQSYFKEFQNIEPKLLSPKKDHLLRAEFVLSEERKLILVFDTKRWYFYSIQWPIS